MAGVLTFPKFWNGEDAYVFVFISSDFSGEIIDCVEGDLEWINKNEILNLNLHEGDYKFIPWILENKFFSAKFNYGENKNLINYVILIFIKILN